MFKNFETWDFPECSRLAEVAHSSYQTKTVFLFLDTMKRLHLRQMSCTIMFVCLVVFSSRVAPNVLHCFYTSNYDYDSAWPNWGSTIPIISVIYGCITNYYNLSSFKQQTYSIASLSQSRHRLAVSSLVSHTAAIKVSARASVSTEA